MIIPAFSFEQQNDDCNQDLIQSFNKVLTSNYYVLGKELKKFEKTFSSKSKVEYAIGVGSGLDALTIALKSLGIGLNDEVIVASNAYIASWLSITNVGAKIIPVEPDPNTFNIDADKIEDNISDRTKVILPVHLFGQPCDMSKIMRIANKHNLFVVEDNAQSQFATFGGKMTGSFGKINATSFYPTKNIGALGEAGCITTNDRALQDFCSAFRNYGSKTKYVSEIIGTNSRLDELQASFLNVKIKYVDRWIKQRNRIAKSYYKNLKSIENLELPVIHENATHVFHQFVVKTSKRDNLKKYLAKKGIDTIIHYPIPPYLQKAYMMLNFKKGDFPISEKLANQSLSLPIYPGLNDRQIEYICDSIIDFFRH